MQRLVCLLLSVALTAVAVSAAMAQADAQRAYQEAKTAYQSGKFVEARDLAEKASQTDPKNAEVFLLLGKAHYQLGGLEEAIAAWKQTLALAPEEPFAARMLDALKAERVEVDTRIKLIEVFVRQRLYDAASKECSQVLANQAISAVQRAKIMTIQADLLLRKGGKDGPTGAQRVLEQLLVLYPSEADAVQTTLLSGQIKLRLGGESLSEGIALLRTVMAEHAGTSAAATAQYELLCFDLQQGPDAAWTDAMAKWIADNPEHPLAFQARRELINGYLEVTRRLGKPAKDAGLSPTDAKALLLATGLYNLGLRADEAKQLTDELLNHLEAHYAKNGANAAAVQAAETLLAASLPPRSRLLALNAQARYQTGIALAELEEQARAGRLPQGVPRGKLPQALAEVVAIYDTIGKEFPAEPTWADRARLAARLRQFAPKVLPSAEFKGLKGPDAWALDIALQVIKANADAAATSSAVETVQAIIQERSDVQKPESQKLAVNLGAELVEALSPSHPTWSAVMAAHAGLLDGQARALFDENLKAGRTEENAKLSEPQKQLLATLEKHVARETAHAPAALEQLGKHLRPWIAHGHWAVAEQAYTALAQALPEAERREADLAVVNVWIQQATREHQQLAAAGLTVPRQLHPALAKALARCYQLQAGLDDEPSKLAEVRRVWDTIVGHYKALEYYDVAEAAVQLKSDPAVEAADEYAAFQVVQLKEEAARRELDRFLKQYGASEKIVLSPAFKEAIAGWKKFVADRPTSSLALQAVERIFGIGQLLQRHAAHDVAAGVYDDLAEYSATVKVLSVSAPDKPSIGQRAAFAAAQARDAEARRLLAQRIAERTGDQSPPKEVSQEFAAALAAYLGFVQSHPKSPLAGDAIGKIMAIALEYAKVDAWTVADTIYADLLESKLAIRRPQRLEFCRALCHLGQAIPDHAREMLATLTEGGLREPGDRRGETLLAGRLLQALRGVGEDAMTTQPAGQPVAPGHEAAGPATALPASRPHGGGFPSPTEGQAAQRRPPQADRDAQLLAMIRNQEANRAARVAQLREQATGYQALAMIDQSGHGQQAEQAQQALAGQQAPPIPVLSEAELARQEKALTAAYDAFQGIRQKYPDTATAEQARGEILVMVGHWRSVGQWQRAAALATRFLDDNPTDIGKPKIRLESARDWLTWASKPIERKPTKQAMLSEVSSRFQRAREELTRIVTEFPKERTVRQQAQWDVARSFLAQARVVDAFSPTLARGQYVRAARELQRVGLEHPNHPDIGKIPRMLWEISQELEGRQYYSEAILVWNDLGIYYPMDPLAQQAALKIAQTYHQKLQRPLKAAEAYQELNFARRGNQQDLQNSIFQIGSELKAQARWVEALHVLGMFVDSFPNHQQAGQALTMIGQIHQTNEAWEDAIAAYRRVIDEFEDGQWVQDAKWAIAECTINLSQWSEATEAYRKYVEAYRDDQQKVAQANRRIEVLKDLGRYQALVDEEGQRRAFDAQFQIAAIVASQLSNPVKAIIEYRKVVSTWPESHLADDALYEVGSTYLALGQTEKSREALLAVAEKYPASPLADDALFMVGKSYEDEADKLATITREQSIEQARDIAQRFAYEQVQTGRRRQEEIRRENVASLKKAGKAKAAEVEEAFQAANFALFNEANVRLFAQQAGQKVETITATQLADRQDKINAALRRAVDAYTKTSKVAGADKADEALLQMATIYDQRLKDSKAAMATWLEIVRQFSGTTVAENASWRIAQTYERQQKYAEAVQAYEAFLRNYRRSPNAGQAQFAIAEDYEHLGEWVKAMDSYTNYLNNFPDGPLTQKAKEQINWIKTYRL